jgi:DNA-binding Lrp family transcriptional regulator
MICFIKHGIPITEIQKLTELLQSIFVNSVKPVEMLDTTFVLLSCEQKMVASVIEKIKMIPTVSDVQQVDGCYDVVVCLKAESHHAINHIIAEKIRLIDGIRTCITLPDIRSRHNSLRRLGR